MSLTYVSGTLLAQGNILHMGMHLLFPVGSHTPYYLSIHLIIILNQNLFVSILRLSVRYKVQLSHTQLL